MTHHFQALAAARRHLIETKDAGDPFEILTKKFGQHADQTLERIKAVESETKGVRAVVQDLEQQLARDGGAPASMGAKSWGEQFVACDRLKDFADDSSRPGRFRLEIERKDITTLAASGGALAGPFRDNTITALPRRTMTIRNLLSVVQMSGNVAEYIVQTSRPDDAAPVAEAALKPKSDMTMEARQKSARVIAHWIAASRQVLDDSPQLRDLIDTELRYGLQEAEENQLLNGDDTGANLDGLIPNATAFSDTLALPTPNRIDTIASAIHQSAMADLPADGVVLHPADWMRMRTLKDADGKYILGNPGDAVEQVLFGLPVVTTKAIAAGNFLVGNFKAAATIYDRWQPVVMVSTEHDDFFTRNMVAILAEERLALAVKQPLALTYGAFS